MRLFHKIHLEPLLVHLMMGGLALVLLTPLIFSVRTSYTSTFSQSLYFRFMVELMVLLYGVLLIHNRAWRPRRSPILVITLLLFASMTISSILGFNPARSFWGTLGRGEGLLTQLHFLAFFLMLTAMVRRQAEWLMLLRVLVATSIPIGIIGILQTQGLYRFGSLDCTPAYCPRIHGTFNNSGSYGSYLALIIFIALVVAVLEKNKYGKWGWFGFAVFNMVLLLLTGARASWLGLIAGAAVIGVIGILRLPKQAFKKRLAILLGAFIASFTLLGLVFARTQGYFQDNILLDRLEAMFSNLLELQHYSRFLAWKVGIRAWQEHPWIGSGLESLAYYYDRFADSATLGIFGPSSLLDRAHNHWIDLLVTSGVVGLVSYLTLIFLAFRALIKAKLGLGNSLAWPLVLLVGFWVAHEVQYLFTFPATSTYLIIFVMLAFLNALCYQGRIESVHPSGSFWSLPKRLAGTLGITGMLGLAIIFFVVLPLRADLRFVQSIHLLDAGKLKDSITLFEKARIMIPAVRRFEMELFFTNELNHFRRRLPSQSSNRLRLSLIHEEVDRLTDALEAHLNQGLDISPLYAQRVLWETYGEQYTYGVFQPQDPKYLKAQERVRVKAARLNPVYPWL